MKKFCLPVLILMASLSFFSCDNFFTGSELSKEIESVIAEAKAPFAKLYISADADTGSVTPGGYEEYKVEKAFTVVFSESSKYQFIEWEVINEKTKEPMPGVVQIDNLKSPRIEVKLLQVAEGVMLHPVCKERPAVVEVSPKKSEEGDCRDSSIIITFNKPISQNNDFSSINITVGGESVAECFNLEEASVTENVLTILAYKNNMISVGSGSTKTVNVTIPGNFYYEDNSEKIYIGDDYSFNYKINESTNQKAEITFVKSEDKGKITPFGTNRYSIGETVSVTFEPNPGYNFTGWNVVDGNNKPVKNSVLKVEKQNELTAQITVRSSASGIKVYPSSILVPTVEGDTEFTKDGLSCDTPIILKFNRPMNKSDVESFENIRIMNSYLINADSFEEYFEVPSLGGDGKTLTIKPKGNKISEIFGMNSYVDLYISVSNLIETTDGVSLSDFYEEDLQVLIVRIIPEREEKAPLFAQDGLKIFKNKTSTLVSDEAYADWDEESEAWKLNHLNSIKIACAGYDSDSGIDALKITETLLYSKNGTEVNKKIDTYIPRSCFGIFENKGEGLFESDIDYNFFAEEDGIIKLEMQLVDYAGNLSREVKTYYFLKDTVLDNAGLTICNVSLPYVEWYTEFDTTFDELKEEIRNNPEDFYITLPIDSYFAAKETKGAGLNPKIFVGKTRDSLEPITDFEILDTNIINFTILREDLLELTKANDAFIKLVLEDEAGNLIVQEAIIPKVASYKFYISNDSKSFDFYINTPDLELGYAGYGLFYWYKEDEDGKSYWYHDRNSWNYTVSVTKKSTLHNYVAYRYTSAWQNICGLISEDFEVFGGAQYQEISFPTYEYIALPLTMGNFEEHILQFYLSDEMAEDTEYYITVYDEETDTEAKPIFFNKYETPEEVDFTLWPDEGNTISTEEKFTAYAYAVVEIRSIDTTRLRLYGVKNNYRDWKEDNPYWTTEITPYYDNVAPVMNSVDNEKVEMDATGRSIIIKNISDPCNTNALKPCSGLYTEDGINTKIKVLVSDFNDLSYRWNEDYEMQMTEYVVPLKDYRTIENVVISFDPPSMRSFSTYYVYVMVSDRNGNSTLLVSYALYYRKSNLEFGYSDGILIGYNSGTSKVYLCSEKEITYTLYNPSHGKNGESVTVKLSSDNDRCILPDYYKNSWVIVNSCVYSSSRRDYVVSNPLYLYLDTDLNFSSLDYDIIFPDGAYTNKKKLFDVSSSIVGVSSKAPVLIQTYMSKYQLNSMEDWERCAKTSGTQALEPDVDFYTMKTEEVPVGWYYCAIAHFIDGTALMSEVYKK